MFILNGSYLDHTFPCTELTTITRVIGPDGNYTDYINGVYTPCGNNSRIQTKSEINREKMKTIHGLNKSGRKNNRWR